jgi:AraC-like DNA-binding protein
MLSITTNANHPPFPVSTALPACTDIRSKFAEVVTCRCDEFGEIRAELRPLRSNQDNELDVPARMHTLMMRTEGVASRCEIVWPRNDRRKMLSELRPGAILFSPAGCPAHVTKKDRGSFGYIALQIPCSALEPLADVGRDSSDIAWRPQAGAGHAELCRVMFAMRDEIDEPGPAGRLYKETLALQLLIQLVRYASNLTIAPAKGGLPAWRLRRAIELIEADLTQSPSIRMLAAEVGLSPAHFCTAFKQSTGQSPHRYLLHCKLAHAKRLMSDSRLSLTEIALMSGFTSSSQFATTFRRINGMTPSAYHRNCEPGPTRLRRGIAAEGEPG